METNIFYLKNNEKFLIKDTDIINLLYNENLELVIENPPERFYWIFPKEPTVSENKYTFAFLCNGYYALVLADSKITFSVKIVQNLDIKLELIILPLANKFQEEICKEIIEVIDLDDKIILQDIDKNILRLNLPDEDYLSTWISPNSFKIESNEIEITESGIYKIEIYKDNSLYFSHPINILINRDPLITLNVNNQNLTCGNIFNIIKPLVKINGIFNINYLNDETVNFELYLNDELVNSGNVKLNKSKASLNLGEYIINTYPTQLKCIISLDELIDICIISIRQATIKILDDNPIKIDKPPIKTLERSHGSPVETLEKSNSITLKKSVTKSNESTIKKPESVKKISDSIHKIRRSENTNKISVCNGHSNKCKIIHRRT